MPTQIRTLLAPPHFASDDTKTRAAGILYPALLLMLAAFGCYIALGLIVPNLMMSRFVIVAPGALVILALVVLVRRGYVRLASVAFTALIWLIVSGAMLIGGGVQSSAFGGLVIVVLSAGLLLSWRAALRAALLGALTGTVFWYATVADMLPSPSLIHTPTSIWATAMLILAIATVLLSRARSSIDAALDQAQQELAERQRVEASLRSSEARYRTLAHHTAR
jgi:hypothetical protein